MQMEKESVEIDTQKLFESKDDRFYFLKGSYSGEYKTKTVPIYDRNHQKTREEIEYIPHGNGKLVSEEGFSYDGEWNNGLRHGYGTLTWEDGEIYEGDWKNDRREGLGNFISSNGDEYEGRFKNNERSGNGVFKWLDGSQYDGDWEFNHKNGRGIMTSVEWEYNGEWKWNKMHGKGKLSSVDGWECEGEFKDGEFFNGERLIYNVSNFINKIEIYEEGKVTEIQKLPEKIEEEKMIPEDNKSSIQNSSENIISKEDNEKDKNKYSFLKSRSTSNKLLIDIEIKNKKKTKSY